MAIVKTDSIHYSNIAAKIREKTGEATTYLPSEMPSGIDAVYEAGKSAGGGNPSEYLDAFVEGATEITSNASFVGSRVFRTNLTVKKATFPVATEILTEAFGHNSTIVEVYAPKVTGVGESAFLNANNFEKIEIPEATQIARTAFQGCTKLAQVSAPNMQRVYVAGFYKCRSLSEIYMPHLVYIESSVCGQCAALSYVELGPLTQTLYIYREAFNGCTSLTALVIRATQFVKLENINAFTGTPIESGTGYIYVPSSLISNFQNATNWSTFANQFRALEDYTVDGTTTGEFDRTKI